MNLNIYGYQFTAQCPVDGALIYYVLEIAAQKMIKAEAVKEACTFDEPVFHEVIADQLFERFGERQVLQELCTRRGVEIKTVRGDWR